MADAIVNFAKATVHHHHHHHAMSIVARRNRWLDERQGQPGAVPEPPREIASGHVRDAGALRGKGALALGQKRDAFRSDADVLRSRTNAMRVLRRWSGMVPSHAGCGSGGGSRTRV
jgi:hypothetical protein